MIRLKVSPEHCTFAVALFAPFFLAGNWDSDVLFFVRFTFEGGDAEPGAAEVRKPGEERGVCNAAGLGLCQYPQPRWQSQHICVPGRFSACRACLCSHVFRTTGYGQRRDRRRGACSHGTWQWLCTCCVNPHAPPRTPTLAGLSQSKAREASLLAPCAPASTECPSFSFLALHPLVLPRCLPQSVALGNLFSLAIFRSQAG